MHKPTNAVWSKPKTRYPRSFAPNQTRQTLAKSRNLFRIQIVGAKIP